MPMTGSVVPSHMSGVLRSGVERLHDITTSLEAEIPESATRVLLLYRINSAFANVDDETAALHQGFGGRFALRVRQMLPFSPIEGSRWEVLVDIPEPVPRAGRRRIGLRRAPRGWSTEGSRWWTGRELLIPESPTRNEPMRYGCREQ